MNLNNQKYCVSLILLCAVLANKVKETESAVDVGNIIMGALPTIAGWIGGPVQPIVANSMKIMALANDYFREHEVQDVALLQGVFLESQAKMAESIKNVDAHIFNAVEKIIIEGKSSKLMEKMRNALDEMEKGNIHNMKVILNKNITGIPKQATMHAMLDYHSQFRTILRSFVSKFIKPRGFVPGSGQTELMYDLVLEKDQYLINLEDDCHSESTHSRLFKTYMYILKILTDSYAMIVTAHTVQYQSDVNSNNLIEAKEIQKLSLELLEQYKLDMKEFMSKTQWALDLASREIRNCGKFDLKQGETFESISFAHTLPKIKDWDLDPRPSFAIGMHHARPRYLCHDRPADVDVDQYEIIGECTDGGLKTSSELFLFVNLTNSDWPYMYLVNNPHLAPEQVIGHSVSGPALVMREFATNRAASCHPSFCPSYKRKSIGFSTQIVRAKPGNAITGLRLRIRSNIIYIDIQEGKFIDEVQVDPETVTWTETPQSDQVLYMSAKVKKLELGTVEVPGNQFLTAIQFKLKNQNDGIVGLVVGGSSAQNSAISDAGLTGASDSSSKSNELLLSGCDSAELIGGDLKNMISKPPVASQPYHVTFQPSDFQKDFGRRTVPSFEVREVVTHPPGPLGGVGIYHQSVKGSCGFVSMILKSPNLTSFVDYNVIEQLIKTTQAD